MMDVLDGDTLILIFEALVGYIVFRMSRGFESVLQEIKRQGEERKTESQHWQKDVLHQYEFNRARDKTMMKLLEEVNRKMDERK